jgi:hypothetical protein
MRGDNWGHERPDLTSGQTRRVRLLAETDYRMSANPGNLSPLVSVKRGNAAYDHRTEGEALRMP